MKYSIIEENNNYYFINQNNDKIVINEDIKSVLENQEQKIEKLTNFASNCLMELEAVL